MAYPAMSNGDSMLLFTYAMHCEDLLMRVDPQLDTPAFAEQLYASRQPAASRIIQRPPKANFRWDFSECDLGI